MDPPGSTHEHKHSTNEHEVKRTYGRLNVFDCRNEFVKWQLQEHLCHRHALKPTASTTQAVRIRTLAQFHERQSDAEHNLWPCGIALPIQYSYFLPHSRQARVSTAHTFMQENVPNAERTFQWKTPSKDREKPIRSVQRRGNFLSPLTHVNTRTRMRKAELYQVRGELRPTKRKQSVEQVEVLHGAKHT